ANSLLQARAPQTGLLRDEQCSLQVRHIVGRTFVAASPALYRHGLLSKITLKKVFPSRPDSL
ncbi:MAG: hypothetical protein AAF497_26340, partial [Planctomycetota bacterium]